MHVQCYIASDSETLSPALQLLAKKESVLQDVPEVGTYLSVLESSLECTNNIPIVCMTHFREIPCHKRNLEMR